MKKPRSLNNCDQLTHLCACVVSFVYEKKHKHIIFVDFMIIYAVHLF